MMEFFQGIDIAFLYNAQTAGQKSGHGDLCVPAVEWVTTSCAQTPS